MYMRNVGLPNFISSNFLLIMQTSLGKLEHAIDHQQRLETYQRSLHDLVDSGNTVLTERDMETEDLEAISQQIQTLKVLFVQTNLIYVVFFEDFAMISF